MTASDFRNIVVRNDASKAERLFRAAVSAFCSITRPTRREVVQLGDLTLPLLDFVSIDARRYVAAALSECRIAPAGLVSRLADDRIDVAAPLLVRSPMLKDVELISLISRHGLPHARAIARRPGLNPTIAQLIRALEASASSNEPLSMQTPTLQQPIAPQETSGSVEHVRDQLRMMMRSESVHPASDVVAELRVDPAAFGKLRDSALTGNDVFFRTALANALGMNLESVRQITRGPGYSALLSALRAMDFSEEQAFVVAAAVFPGQFPHAEAIRIFLGRYRALDRDTALERVRGWKLEMVAQWVGRSAHAGRQESRTLVASNTDRPAGGTLIRAS